MFICEPCHDKDATCKNGFMEGLMRSRGRCEVCGNSAACLDCHGYKAVAAPKPEPKPESIDCPECGGYDLPVDAQGYTTGKHKARCSLR